MKRTRYLMIVLATLCIALSGCCISHDWKEASCTEPKTCAKCGKTEGAPLGHTWIEATCTEPRTCSVCRATEGTPKEHQWEEATCTTSKRCIVCGWYEGKPLGHHWMEATVDRPKTCSVCGATEGEPLRRQYFNMTAREFVDAFNQKYSLNGQMMYFKEEGINCNLYLMGEQMNYFLRFFDTSQRELPFISGLSLEEWNKVGLYVATDDVAMDAEFFASYGNWLAFLSDTAGVEFDSQKFLDGFSNVGSDRFPELQYTENGIRYVLRFYDDSATYREPTTVYAAEVEMIQ